MQNLPKVRLSSIFCYKMLNDFGYLTIKDRFSEQSIKIEKKGRKSLYHAVKEAVSFLLKGDSHFVVSSDGHEFFVDSTKNNEINDNPSQQKKERNKAYCYDISDKWITEQLDFYSEINVASEALDAMSFMRETDEGMSWYDCWNEGNFEAIFYEWPDTPMSVVFGCDSLVFSDI